MADDLPAQLLQILALIVLAGDHHGGDPAGAAVPVLHGHLGLAVWLQAVDGPCPAGVGEQAGQPVGQHYGQGQKFCCLAAGVAV